MQIEKIIEELDAMPEDGDQEDCHLRADELLLELLVELGRGDVVNAFRKAKQRLPFWYA